MARRSRPSITLSAMKPTELMIGDWVMFTDPADGSKYPVRLKSINANTCCGIEGKSLLSLTDDFEPIPITPEILEKNGFKPQGTGWILEDSIGERIFNLCRISNAYCLLTAGKTLAFQYVHELQHLFRLAGTKGEIKL